LSIGDGCERPPSAQRTWRVVTAGGSTGVDGTAAPALVTSAPFSPRNHRFLHAHTPAVAEPVARRRCRLVTATSGPRVPSPPAEWLPPVVRRESTGQPLQHWSHLPHSHRGIIVSAYTHPCCGRARSAPLSSIGDGCERPPSAQPTWRVVTAGGLTGNDRTAGPALDYMYLPKSRVLCSSARCSHSSQLGRPSQ
jgi:hypothetical protein